MIVNDKDAVKRLDSPMNLINRLKNTTTPAAKNAMQLFGVGRGSNKPVTIIEPTEHSEVEISFNPFQAKEQSSSLVPTLETSQAPSLTPVLDDILTDPEAQIKLGLAHDSALNLLNKSVALLETKLDDVKADRLPLVIRATGDIITNIRRQQIANKSVEKDKEVHFHFYTPQQKKVEEYEVVDVT